MEFNLNIENKNKLINFEKKIFDELYEKIINYYNDSKEPTFLFDGYAWYPILILLFPEFKYAAA